MKLPNKNVCPLSLSQTEHGSNTVYSVIHELTGTSIAGDVLV